MGSERGGQLQSHHQCYAMERNWDEMKIREILIHQVMYIFPCISGM